MKRKKFDPEEILAEPEENPEERIKETDDPRYPDEEEFYE